MPLAPPPPPTFKVNFIENACIRITCIEFPTEHTSRSLPFLQVRTVAISYLPFIHFQLLPLHQTLRDEVDIGVPQIKFPAYFSIRLQQLSDMKFDLAIAIPACLACWPAWRL